MTNYINAFYGVLYTSIFLIVFATAWNSLKPFKLHKKRKYSTLALKSTYLLYLAFYLVFVMILIFNQNNKINSQDLTDKWLKFYLAVFMIITLLPNLGILFRRRIRHGRIKYNVAFVVINSVSLIVLVILLMSRNIGII